MNILIYWVRGQADPIGIATMEATELAVPPLDYANHHAAKVAHMANGGILDARRHHSFMLWWESIYHAAIIC